MNINGFQKMTLLDFPGKVACTLFTGGCNMRCPFCHNASLVINGRERTEYSEEEILSYLKKRQGILEGVCITGGEPLLQPDIEQFIIKVRELGYAIKLDTNGALPERLISLCEKGLVAPDGLVIVEHDFKTPPEVSPLLILKDQRRYGIVGVSIYRLP